MLAGVRLYFSSVTLRSLVAWWCVNNSFCVPKKTALHGVCSSSPLRLRPGMLFCIRMNLSLPSLNAQETVPWTSKRLHGATTIQAVHHV